MQLPAVFPNILSCLRKAITFTLVSSAMCSTAPVICTMRPNFLLQQEVAEVGSYFSIIKAIAAGNSRVSAIASMLEVKATGLTKYLKTLMDLDIVGREVPVTEENPEKSKKGPLQN